MSAELEQYEPPQPPALSGDLGRLVDTATALEAAYGMAKRLVATSFSPAQYRDKPEEAAAAMLAGAEVGLSPLAALRSFDIIGGVAAPRALTLRAVVQAHGHEMVLVESTATRCKMRGRRKGSIEWQEVTYTLDRAKQLGLTSKSNWRNQPTAMLLSRATSELARLVAADAILGIGYSVEELQDSDVVEPSLPSQPPTKRTAQRRLAPAPEPASVEEPDLDPSTDDADDSTPDAPSPGRLTEAQQKRMHASFTELGITDRDARLTYTANVIGRVVESSNDLSVSDGIALLNALDADLRDVAASTEGPPL